MDRNKSKRKKIERNHLGKKVINNTERKRNKFAKKETRKSTNLGGFKKNSKKVKRRK